MVFSVKLGSKATNIINILKHFTMTTMVLSTNCTFHGNNPNFNIVMLEFGVIHQIHWCNVCLSHLTKSCQSSLSGPLAPEFVIISLLSMRREFTLFICGLRAVRGLTMRKRLLLLVCSEVIIQSGREEHTYGTECTIYNDLNHAHIVLVVVNEN